MNKELDVKREALYREVRKLGSCVIAFSGGTDSALLLAVAKEVLGDRTLAVTATSAIYPARERDEARELAQRIGVRHQVIASRELELPAFVENTKSRCYYCKSELFSRLRAIAQAEGLTHLIDGANRAARPPASRGLSVHWSWLV
jgi:uncharacterized protein